MFNAWTILGNLKCDEMFLACTQG